MGGSLINAQKQRDTFGRLASAHPDARRYNDRSKAKGAEFMAKTKITARVPWTKEDVRALKAHSKSRTPAAEVAKALKRTEAAVRQKAKTIGIGLGHRR
jgi:hypothetical protein